MHAYRLSDVPNPFGDYIEGGNALDGVGALDNPREVLGDFADAPALGI